MEMYTAAYNALYENDPNCELVEALKAHLDAQIAVSKAMEAAARAKEAAQKAEINHYHACFNTARAEFGDRPFTAAELEEAVGHRINKNSVASMIAYAQTPENVKSVCNKKNRRTEKLLPSDIKDSGFHKYTERHFLPCDASGKPIEGAAPITMRSKGAKLYKFGD